MAKRQKSRSDAQAPMGPDGAPSLHPASGNEADRLLEARAALGGPEVVDAPQQAAASCRRSLKTNFSSGVGEMQRVRYASTKPRQFPKSAPDEVFGAPSPTPRPSPRVEHSLLSQHECEPLRDRALLRERFA